MTTRNYAYANNLNMEDILKMHPALMSIYTFTTWFCYQYNIDCHWTSFHRPKDKISKSKTHQTYRALDLSLDEKHGWTQSLKDQYEADINIYFKNVGALVWKGGKLVSRPILIHKNKIVIDNKVVELDGEHAHLQIRWNINRKITNNYLSYFLSWFDRFTKEYTCPRKQLY